MDILEKLRALDESAPIPPSLPTEADVRAAEAALGVTFPPSYVRFQLHYSDVSFGQYELFGLSGDEGDAALLMEVKEAREHNDLDEHLLPFVEDNGDYFCFDLTSAAPEYEVVYWSHNGTTGERWNNFLDWVENCWIKEGLGNTNDADA